MRGANGKRRKLWVWKSLGDDVIDVEGEPIVRGEYFGVGGVCESAWASSGDWGVRESAWASIGDWVVGES